MVKIFLSKSASSIFEPYFCCDFDEGPLHGLKMTLNVQQYENLPFLDKDSGLKVSPSY